MTQTVREFSSVGPRITLGTLTKETAKSFCFTDREGKPGIVRKGTWGKTHIVPCSSCRDHPQTRYPNGYMD